MQIFVKNSFQSSLDEEKHYSVTVGLRKGKRALRYNLFVVHIIECIIFKAFWLFHTIDHVLFAQLVLIYLIKNTEKNINIVKLYYDLKQPFSFWIHFKL